jgi:hypothetical protein
MDVQPGSVSGLFICTSDPDQRQRSLRSTAVTEGAGLASPRWARNRVSLPALCSVIVMRGLTAQRPYQPLQCGLPGLPTGTVSMLAWIPRLSRPQRRDGSLRG